MAQSTRKFIGTLFLLIFVMAYAVLAVALGDPVMARLPETIRFGYYVVAGLAWTLPAMVVIRWMQRP